MSVHLTIPGRPRSGERAGTSPDGHRYSQENTRAVQRDIAAAWTTRPEPWRSPILHGPVAVRIVLHYGRDKSHLLKGGGLSAHGRRHPYPTTTRADLDNLAKPLVDGLTGLAWVDDHQVCDLAVAKRWADERGPRSEVWITPLAAPVDADEELAA